MISSSPASLLRNAGDSALSSLFLARSGTKTPAPLELAGNGALAFISASFVIVTPDVMSQYVRKMSCEHVNGPHRNGCESASKSFLIQQFTPFREYAGVHNLRGGTYNKCSYLDNGQLLDISNGCATNAVAM